jgi:hypothetical protein
MWRGGLWFCFLEELLDLVIGGLGEILIPQAYRQKGFRRVGTDDLVDIPAKFITSLCGGHRNRHDDALRLLPLERLGGRFHAGTGGQAIVDQKDRAMTNGPRRPTSPVQLLSAFQLAFLAGCDLIDESARELQFGHEGFIEYPDTSARQSPNRQFLLTWQSELPHQENIQFGVQGPSDFEADRHAAPGKRQDQGLGIRHERQDLLREDSTRLAAISKERLDSHVCTSKMSHLLCP